MTAYAPHHVRERQPSPLIQIFRRALRMAMRRKGETAPALKQAGAVLPTVGCLPDLQARMHADRMHDTYARYADRQRPVNGRSLGTLPRRDAGATFRSQPLVDRGPDKPPWMTAAWPLPTPGQMRDAYFGYGIDRCEADVDRLAERWIA